MRLFSILLLIFPSFMFGQYEFDSLPKPVCVNNNNWVIYEGSDTDTIYHRTITTKNFFNDSADLTMQFTTKGAWKEHDNTIMIYKNKKTMQFFFNEPFGYWGGATGISDFPIQIADLNGDGLKDIKIIEDYHTNGLAMCYRIIYFIQNPDNTFTKISYDNMSEEKEIHPERDFDHDGKFEFFRIYDTGLNQHSYWTYNIYKFNGKTIENVSLKYNYPILVPFNYVRSYNSTKVKFNKLDYLIDTDDMLIDHGTKVNH